MHVPGVVQIIEIYQHSFAAHVHNKTEAGAWELVPVHGSEAILELASLGLSIPLADIYEDAVPPDQTETE